MDFLSAIFLGIVQGISEWLPVSSSAQNLLLMVGVFKLDPQVAFSFSVYLHFGTLLAALLRFRRELIEALKSFISSRKSKLVSFMFYATIFSALSGLPLYLFLKASFLETQGVLVTAFIGVLLIITGIVLYKSKKHSLGDKTLDSSSKLDSSLAGLVQGIAVLPGVSRSGFTISSLLLRGYKAEDALRLTFIISIPAVLGLVAVELLSNSFIPVDPLVAFTGILTSFIVGYLTIDFLLRFANKLRFDFFCIGFGALAFLISLFSFFNILA